jgi:Putative peptidoglycan binding domain
MSTHYQTMRKSNPSTLLTATLAVVSTLAVVLVVVIALAASHAFSHHSSGTNAPPAAVPAPAPASGDRGAHTTPVKPAPAPTPVRPSAAVKTLQQQLAQLNYYEGPADGIMGNQTIQAIQYLQRDAGLPQTGQMNAATAAALHNFLVHGNNQMAG